MVSLPTTEGAVISCDTGSYGLRVMVAALPAWWRFAQCLRRYYDTWDANPHLINAGKYSTSFFVVIFSSVASTLRGEREVPPCGFSAVGNSSNQGTLIESLPQQAGHYPSQMLCWRTDYNIWNLTCLNASGLDIGTSLICRFFFMPNFIPCLEFLDVYFIMCNKLWPLVYNVSKVLCIPMYIFLLFHE